MGNEVGADISAPYRDYYFADRGQSDITRASWQHMDPQYLNLNFSAMKSRPAWLY